MSNLLSVRPEYRVQSPGARNAVVSKQLLQDPETKAFRLCVFAKLTVLGPIFLAMPHGH